MQHSLINNKILNVDDKNPTDILKVLLRKDNLSIIHTGSFALYYMKNNINFKDKCDLIINDIDLDLYKFIEDVIIKNNSISIRDKAKIGRKIDKYFTDLFSGIEEYENVEKYRVSHQLDNIKVRNLNNGTIGLKVKVYVSIKGKPDEISYKLDVNLENKQFITEINYFEIDGELFKAKTYAYEKILADKIIATTKHIEILRKENLNLYSPIHTLKKLSKDFYDLNFILLKNLDMDLVFIYTKQLANINASEFNPLLNILKEIKGSNSDVFSNRDVGDDIILGKLKEIIMKNYN